MIRILIASCFLLCGCVSLPEKIDQYAINIVNKNSGQEIIVKASYKEAFLAAIDVLRDLGLNVMKKDYREKSIYATTYPLKYYGHYAFVFEPAGNETKITLKSEGHYLDPAFILDKVQEEIQLRHDLNSP